MDDEYGDMRPAGWEEQERRRVREMTPSQREAWREFQRRQNNPRGEPTGDHTGRCQACGSRDLWTDNLAYGCNNCGALLGTN